MTGPRRSGRSASLGPIKLESAQELTPASSPHSCRRFGSLDGDESCSHLSSRKLDRQSAIRLDVGWGSPTQPDFSRRGSAGRVRFGLALHSWARGAGWESDRAPRRFLTPWSSCQFMLSLSLCWSSTDRERRLNNEHPFATPTEKIERLPFSSTKFENWIFYHKNENRKNHLVFDKNQSLFDFLKLNFRF
jgi:hypothetical protein